MPLGCRATDQLDLAVVESEPLIGGARLRFDGAIVRQKDALRAAFDDGRGDGAVGNVRKTLCREHHGDVALSQHLQPFTDAGREQRMVEEHPRFVERSEEHTSELQSLMRNSYAVFCLKKKN